MRSDWRNEFMVLGVDQVRARISASIWGEEKLQAARVAGPFPASRWHYHRRDDICRSRCNIRFEVAIDHPGNRRASVRPAAHDQLPAVLNGLQR
jgi:hypothetical protein